MPPLRERKEDIICLAEAFSENWTKKYRIHKELSPEALGRLYDYHWPGNVRELENVVHQLDYQRPRCNHRRRRCGRILNENVYGDMMINVKKALIVMNRWIFIS